MDADAINYWADLIDEDVSLFDVQRVKQELTSIKEKIEFFTIDMTGLFAYVIAPDFRGRTTLAEVIFYIKPIYRGNLRLVRRYIRRAEREAKAIGCASISIGGNIGYKDQSFLKLLGRWGYHGHTAAKYLEV